MSVPATEGQEPVVDSQGSQVLDLPPQGDAAFGALMDFLAPEDGSDPGAPAGSAAGDPAGGAAAAGDPAGAGGAAAGGEGAAGADAGRPAAGAGDAPAGDGNAAAGSVDGAAGAAAGTGPVDGTAAAGTAQPGADATGGDRPASWTASADELIPKFGELSTKFEENFTKAAHETALTAMREEHKPYFEALEKHPRLLVGQQVPSLRGEGMETIRDADDAREWQDAVKSILVEEVRGRVEKELADSGDFLTTVHQSIELFQNNADLMPGTATFDVELANRFAEFAEPYELRVEGKLQGYSIPVQPLIERLRAALSAERAAKGSAPAAAGTTTPPAAGAPGAPAAQAASGSPAQTPPAPPEPPQAGIPSKAGNSESSEDFSTLFGTIGLPDLQI